MIPGGVKQAGIASSRNRSRPKKLPPSHPFTLPSNFHTEAQRPAPKPLTQRVASAPKGKPLKDYSAGGLGYNRAHHFSMFGSLVEALQRDRQGKRRPMARRIDRMQKRDPLTHMGFPYANEKQVAFANAAGDVERAILPLAAKLLGGRPPKVHAGPTVDPGDRSRSSRPQGRAGYAWRGENNIYLTPAAYMNFDPNFTRGVALHEMAHTRQSPAPMSHTTIEGGADWMAEQLASKIGLPSYKPGYPDLIDDYSDQIGIPRADSRHLLKKLHALLN